MVKPAKSLGKTIRHRRIELGLTQEELAERIGDGVRQSDISRLERDRIQLPRAQRLRAIAQALAMEPGVLLVKSGWDGALSDLNEPIQVDPIDSFTSMTMDEPVDRPGVNADLHGQLHLALQESSRVREQTAETMRRAEEIAREWSLRFGSDPSATSK